MDETDRNLLNLIQSDFPICSRPFKVIGERLGISEQEALERVSALKASGVIRRIGGSFDSRRLGFYSTLCAARVSEEKLQQFNEVINSYPGVTHNYTREHPFNIWFTFIAQSEEEVLRALKEISQKTGVKEIVNLPARRTFKIRVNFEL